MKFPRINMEKSDALKKTLLLESRDATDEELESIWDSKSDLAAAFRSAYDRELFYRLWGLRSFVDRQS